jgi:hypothetical protein
LAYPHEGNIHRATAQAKLRRAFDRLRRAVAKIEAGGENCSFAPEEVEGIHAAAERLLFAARRDRRRCAPAKTSSHGAVL